MSFHVQCKMSHSADGRLLWSWIPERFARIGKLLRIFNKESKVWEAGWRVVEVYSKEQSKKVEARERLYLHQREVSDV